MVNMQIESIRSLLKVTPFKPFKIRMSDGRSITVPHPDFIFFPPNQRDFVVAHENGGLDILDSNLVTGIETPAGRPAKK